MVHRRLAVIVARVEKVVVINGAWLKFAGSRDADKIGVFGAVDGRTHWASCFSP